jgi:dihydrofolate reductase
MRKIILFMVYSLDGFVGGPNGELDWEDQNPSISMELIPELLSTVDSVIIGRVLYEGFSQFWPVIAKDAKSPKELVEFANWLVNAPKYVVSKSLDSVSWTNSHLISAQNDEDIIREVKKLKESSGGDLVLFGGARLAQTLVGLNLVDEYRFKLQPVVLGEGVPLFKDLDGMRKLKLTKTKAFEGGVVGLYYEPKEK